MIQAFHLFCCKKNIFGSDNENCFPIRNLLFLSKKKNCFPIRKMNMTWKTCLVAFFSKTLSQIGLVSEDF